MHHFAAERWRVQVLVYRLLTGHAKTGHSLFYFTPIAEGILWLARFVPSPNPSPSSVPSRAA